MCLAALPAGRGLLVYAPALGGDLIWDDFYLVRENPLFRSPVFGLEVFRHYLFFDSFSTYYRPVQNWSYMLRLLALAGQPGRLPSAPISCCTASAASFSSCCCAACFRA